MTTTATEPASTNDAWTAQLARLKERYRHVRSRTLMLVGFDTTSI